MGQMLKMLIIDDEENLLFGLKSVMVREGYQVFTAKNGKDGLATARLEKPDLIICDVMMPPPGGFELRRLLSKEPDLGSVPFIFLTARSAQDDKLKGLEDGADDYITKPFDVQELLARVRAVLRRVEKGRQQGLHEADLKLEQLRTLISSNVTHEMRTPVANMISTLDLAMHERFKNQPDDMSQYIDMAMTNAQRLRSLVDDLLFLFDLDQKHIPTFREQIDLHFDFEEPIQEIMKIWQDRDCKAAIEIEPGVSIHAPKLGFRKAVMHLVDNACKFGPPGGTVGISLMAAGEGGCRLVVHDEGPGIPMPLREKVFERHFQVQQGDSRQYGGLGVGLTIAREFARALGGDVTVVDTISGCSMALTLPEAALDWKPNQ